VAAATTSTTIGFQEQLTAEFITQKLQEWGIEHQTGVARRVLSLRFPVVRGQY